LNLYFKRDFADDWSDNSMVGGMPFVTSHYGDYIFLNLAALEVFTYNIWQRTKLKANCCWFSRFYYAWLLPRSSVLWTANGFTCRYRFSIYKPAGIAYFLPVSLFTCRHRVFIYLLPVSLFYSPVSLIYLPVSLIYLLVLLIYLVVSLFFRFVIVVFLLLFFVTG
jgi:hypothetical protein